MFLAGCSYKCMHECACGRFESRRWRTPGAEQNVLRSYGLAISDYVESFETRDISLGNYVGPGILHDCSEK